MEPEAVAATFRRGASSALLAGGGWVFSHGVRAAESDFSARHALPLHAWTVSVDAVRETRNAEGGGGGEGGCGCGCDCGCGGGGGGAHRKDTGETDCGAA